MSPRNEVRLRDFAFSGGSAGARPVSLDELPDVWERASLAERASLTGQFAAHWQRGSRHRLVRDPLGVHKLFFAIDDAGELDVSHYAHDLVQRGIPFRRVCSVPSGHSVAIDPVTREYVLEQYAALPYGDPDAPMSDLEGHAARVRRALDEVFARLARVLEGREVIVTLSGGLDSSTIAAMARAHFPKVRGITFTTPDTTRCEHGDLHFARMVAAHLDIPLEEVEASRERLVSLVDDVLVDGQDFRDFNVHCGLVNAVLADAIAKTASGSAPPVVLTGDAMNELVSDYAPVEYGGARFYDLPRMSAGRLRRFLVLGLDSGDREVGIFGRRGIDCIQPYTLCASAYTQLPGGFLTSTAAKRDLVLRVMGDRIPAPIYDRPKVRAQVGSGQKVGGTLAAMIEAGLDADALVARFAHLFGIRAADAAKEARAFIRGGLYRFTHAYPGSSEEKSLQRSGPRSGADPQQWSVHGPRHR